MPILQKLAVNVRWLVKRDLPRIVEIERQCFARPWEEAEFLHAIRRSYITALVAERGDEVLGFMLYELRKRSIEILSIAVPPEHRRQGVGGQLVGNLKMKHRKFLKVILTDDNLGAHLFLRSHGFQAEVLRGHFGAGDGYLFRYGMDA